MLSAAELVSRSVHSHDADLPSRDARLTYRSGIVDVTSGVAPGYVQGNLAIVPESLAASFHRFCQLNPKPCPIIGMSEVGDPRIPALGIDLDIRTDIPRYRVWRNGQLIEEPTDIMAHWRDDLVAFVIGCSFSFEAIGVPVATSCCGRMSETGNTFLKKASMCSALARTALM